MTTDNLAELFCDSPFHQVFNATLRVTAYKQALLIAAEQDAAAFLLRCPSDWNVTKPLELAQAIAADFMERWPPSMAA